MTPWERKARHERVFFPEPAHGLHPYFDRVKLKKLKTVRNRIAGGEWPVTPSHYKPPPPRKWSPDTPLATIESPPDEPIQEAEEEPAMPEPEPDTSVQEPWMTDPLPPFFDYSRASIICEIDIDFKREYLRTCWRFSREPAGPYKPPPPRK